MVSPLNGKSQIDFFQKDLGERKTVITFANIKLNQ